MVMAKMCWIHVQYGIKGIAYYRRAAAFMSRGLGVTLKQLSVQNDPNADEGALQLKGSNRLREFSGWNEGISHLRETVADSSGWWMFSNDTYARHRFFWGSLAFSFARVFRKNARNNKPMIIGDILPASMFSEGGVDARYISTYLFIVNAPAMAILEYDLIGDAPLHWIATSSELTLTSASCPPQAARFLEAHLCQPDSRSRWRDARVLTEDNLVELRFKATAVVLEHWLSFRAKRLGIDFAPVIDRTGLGFFRALRSIEARLGSL